MSLAPIAFFAYKRPEQTLKALTALANCSLAIESSLYIFCDGPRREGDRGKVAQVREVVAGRKWCGEVTIIARTENVGLASSVIDGVSKLCSEFGKVIVMEDDLIVSSGFLEYMNQALQRYADQAQVMQISGHCFPFRHHHDPEASFFLPVCTSWGWATWSRAWDRFDADAKGYRALAADFELRQRFDLGGAFSYAQMLENQMSGKLDSWAICWWWSFFNSGGLCLYPGRTLVRNIGFGDDASHTTSASDYHDDPHWSSDGAIRVFPDQVQPDLAAFAALGAYLRSSQPPRGVLRRIISRVKALWSA